MDERDAGRLGRVTVYRPARAPRSLVFLFSGTEGFGDDLTRAAQRLAAGGDAVVGVDLPQYLAGLAASSDGCHYVISELEELSKQIQREFGADGYRSPILAGVGAGGTLAYAALAQSPAATVGGAVALDPAPALGTKVRLCAGAPAAPLAGGGFAYGAKPGLPAPLRIVTSAKPSPALSTLAHAVHAELDVAVAGDEGERVVAGLAPLLAAQQASARGALAGLPLVELPAEPHGDLFAVIWSGDGGWRDLDKTIGSLFAERGVPVVGVDSLRYFWTEKSPERVAADLAAILDAYRARWRTSHAVLVGYSFGAGILPFAYNRLPAAARASVVQISMLGIEPNAAFEFHVSGWLGQQEGSSDDDDEGGRPVLPELQRIPAKLLQCAYGEEEPATLCRAKELAAVEALHTRGGHHFDGDYRALAEWILTGARRRIAAEKRERP